MGNSMNRMSKNKPLDKKATSSEKPDRSPDVRAANDRKQRVQEPGEGIRSMKTSNAFRVLNFELYTKPNKPTMIVGTLAIVLCAGYIAYMNLSYDRSKYYSAESEDGSLILRPKKSRWDS